MVKTREIRPEELVREKLGKYLRLMVFWFFVFAIFFLLAGIWHAIVSSQMNTEFFKVIAGDTPIIVAITLSVLSFGSLFVFLVLGCALYSCGRVYCLHFSLASIVVISILGCLALTSLNVYFTQPKTRDKYEETMKEMIGLPPELRTNITNQWMEEYQCTNVTDCQNSIERYILLRCGGEYIACCFILVISFLSVLGLIVSISCIGCIKRPDDDIGIDNAPLAEPLNRS